LPENDSLKPASHTHSVCSALVRWFFSPHVKHSGEALALATEPAAQGVHCIAEPAACEKPGLHGRHATEARSGEER